MRSRPASCRSTANTLLTTADYKFMLEDSRVRALIVSEALLPALQPLLNDLPFLKHVIVSGKDAHGHLHLQQLMSGAAATFTPAPTTADDICFWLYSSGSTGTPKGAVHIHSSLIQTAELYAKPDPRHSRRATSCSPRPSCSLPTASATR